MGIGHPDCKYNCFHYLLRTCILLAFVLRKFSLHTNLLILGIPMSNKDDDWTPMGNKDKTCDAYIS